MTESQDKPKQEKKTLNGLAMRLREAREKAGFLNQKSVAEKLYTTISTVSKWERGTASPPLDSLVELAALYNTTTDYLLTGVQTDHVEASRKYGLSDKALCALEEMNHTIRSDSDLEDVDRRERSNLYSDLENRPHTGYYIHALGFINALLSAPDLASIAFDFTEHAQHVFRMKGMVEKLKALNERYGSSQDKMGNKDNRLNEAKRIAEFRGYRVVHPDIILKTEEYKLNRKWSKLFDSLLNHNDILMNGITFFEEGGGVEESFHTVPAEADEYDPDLHHDRLLSDEELLQLKWLLK